MDWLMKAILAELLILGALGIIALIMVLISILKNEF
jgi:hypothetical protein